MADRPGGTAARRLRVVPTTKKGPSKRLQQGAKSRDEILDAAMRMMSVRGFDGTSIADIARESGLPNSSIYWHFNSKAGILAAVMERGAERFFADVAPQPLQPDDTPAVYLRRRVRESAEVFATHPEFWRLFVLLMLSNDNPDVTEIVQRVRDHGRGSLHTLVATAYSASGQEVALRVADAIADFALAGFDGTFLAMQTCPQRSVERLVDQVAESLIHLAGRTLAESST